MLIDSENKEIIPFVILPVGDMQDIVFFGNEDIRRNEQRLIDLVYLDIEDEILDENIIRVNNSYNQTIVFHIYPTCLREKISERLGINLIIGFVMPKHCLKKNIEETIGAMKLFFNEIMYCCWNYGEKELDIPSKFVKKVNAANYNDYILHRLNAARENMNSANNVLPDARLEFVYKYIKNKCLYHKDIFIFISPFENKIINRVKKYTVLKLPQSEC